jgi:hypothetical protein
MKSRECEFEPEVLAAVIQSRWPERTDAQLRARVSRCQICADVAAVAGAIEELRDDKRDAAMLPASGRVWWLAQMRARRAAAKAAGRPITVAQVLGSACAMGLLGACFGATSTWFQEGLRQALTALDLKALWPSVESALLTHGLLVAGMLALLLLVPAAVYFAVGRD